MRILLTTLAAGACLVISGAAAPSDAAAAKTTAVRCDVPGQLACWNTCPTVDFEQWTACRLECDVNYGCA